MQALNSGIRPRNWLSQPVVQGTILGSLSAAGYTGANIFLRTLTDCDPMWVSGVKAFPTVAIMLPWVLLRSGLGRWSLPSRSILSLLAAAGLLAQFGGNLLFQWSLGIVGIALAVPLCMGAIILCSAVLGRIFVHEVVTPRAFISMCVLVTGIWWLSRGAQAAAQTVVPSGIDNWMLALGVAAACFSGFSYAVLGVVIRYVVAGRCSVAATILTTSLVGLFALCGGGVWRLGVATVIGFSAQQWSAMLLAGLCNFVAFISLTRALQVTTLIYVNALNASQVAMAGLIGVILFDEMASPALAVGASMTVIGIMLMPRSTRVRLPPETVRQQPLSHEDLDRGREPRSKSPSR